MNLTELRQVAWIGDTNLARPITGVIVNFHGLGDQGGKNSADYDEAEYAAAGGLVVFPFCGPWSWMNRNTRSFVDTLLTDVYAALKLSPDMPLIITGGSMGGHAALLYTRYARQRITACMALYPVCDLQYHFSERPDLPRTIRYAFRGYTESFDKLFAEHSPLAQVSGLPDIPYLIIHGDVDVAVNKQAHSDKMVAAMRQAQRRITYLEVTGMGHGSNIPYAILRAKIDFVKSHLAK